jgi:hypothetical protein
MKNLKELAKEVKQAIKKEYPDVKLSVLTSNLDISITVTQLPFYPFLDKEQIKKNLINEPEYVIDGILKNVEKGWYGINYNYVDGDVGLNNKAKTLINKIIEVTQKDRHNYNAGDQTADYCNFNFYLNVSIGSYDKSVLIKEVANG